MSEHKVNPETELAIRKEVEERFGNPPKTFVDLIETEVERRITHYKWSIGIVIFILGVCGTILGFQIKSDMRGYIDSKLSQPVIDKAIHDSTNAAAQMGLMLVTSQWTMNYFMGNFSNAMDRVIELRTNDNFVLISDLPKLFVIQSMTKYDTIRKTLTLDYEPITNTIRIDDPGVMFTTDNNTFKVIGKTLYFTNGDFDGWTNNFVKGISRIEYVRKSLR